MLMCVWQIRLLLEPSRKVLPEGPSGTMQTVQTAPATLELVSFPIHTAYPSGNPSTYPQSYNLNNPTI